jgi:uncharacterized protein
MRREKKIGAIVSLLLGALLSFLPLPAEKVEAVPDPRRASGSFVADGGGVLGPEYITLIDGVCRELQAKTTIELAVVTVNDLDGLEIEDFAEKLFKRFAIGVVGKDNGLLLLCSRDDRAVRLEVGYGLEASIPDALASRLLDENAVPLLGQGLYGRGLFSAARAIAMAAAGGSDTALTLPEPAAWPAEAAPPTPLAQPVQKKKTKWDPFLSSLYFGAGLLGLAGLGLAWTLRRYGKARGKAARYKAAGGAGPISIAWTAAVAGFVLLLVKSGGLLASLASMAVVPGLATAGQLLLARNLRRRLASYRLSCPTCGQPMDMVSDSDDDKFLSPEEAAEEKAGGMDYEFWHCPKCGADEKLAVTLGKASKCPKCGRRTLTSNTTTLVAATREQGGRTRVTETCLNTACGYGKTREHDTPRLSSPTSSPGGSSRPSSGSFGGGRSGGGGASKKF